MNRRTNGKAIRTIRKALGMQQAAVAAAVGISAAYLSQIESGLRQPEIEVAARIAAELGCDVSAITYPTAAEPTEVAS